MNDKQKFILLKKSFDDTELDDNFNFPIIKKMNLNIKDFEDIKVTNFKNSNSVIEKDTTILSMFTFDKDLEIFRKDPFKFAIKYQGFLAVATPDFSVYSTMNVNEIRRNVFDSRWIGAIWQHYGINVIATVTWAKPDTYDICFSGIEKGSIIIISTLGVNNTQDFLNGYKEMMKRIEPQLIIIIGKYIEGIFGNILLYDYIDTFNPKHKIEQLTLFKVSKHIEIKEIN